MGFLKDLFKQMREEANEWKRKKVEFKEKLKNGGPTIGMDVCKYLGGYPGMLKEMKGAITIKKEGFFFEVFNNIYTIMIPVTQILSVDTQGSGKTARLLITYTEHGLISTISFETKDAQMIENAIAKIIQLYAREYEESHPAGNQEMYSGGVDIPDQIKKLSELRDQGILTEEEFQQKKTELLAKL